MSRIGPRISIRQSAVGLFGRIPHIVCAQDICKGVYQCKVNYSSLYPKCMYTTACETLSCGLFLYYCCFITSAIGSGN